MRIGYACREVEEMPEPALHIPRQPLFRVIIQCRHRDVVYLYEQGTADVSR